MMKMVKSEKLKVKSKNVKVKKTELFLEFLLLTFYFSLLTFLTLGCAVGPDFVRPGPPQVKSYTHGTDPVATIPADGQAQTFEQGGSIATDWWRFFNSSKLDAVIKDALANNPKLQAAQASLRQSQDNLRAGYGVFYPQLNAGFDATRQKSLLANLGGRPVYSIFNLMRLKVLISLCPATLLTPLLLRRPTENRLRLLNKSSV